MKVPNIARLPCLALLLASPALLRADDVEPPRVVREFHFEHVDVKEANAIIRSLLNMRKSAIDERRQVLLLGDTPEMLDQAAVLAAQIDQAVPEWSVSLVAQVGTKRVVLRTANISTGRLQVQFGAASADNLIISTVTHRAASGEVELEWSAAVALSEPWIESAQASETLHDGAVVTLLRAASESRKKALAAMLGLLETSGDVDALVLEIAKAGGEQRGGTRLGR